MPSVQSAAELSMGADRPTKRQLVQVAQDIPVIESRAESDGSVFQDVPALLDSAITGPRLGLVAGPTARHPLPGVH
jgi:hypothetical protein